MLFALPACDQATNPPISSPTPVGEVSAQQTEGVFSSSSNLLQNPSLEHTTSEPWFDFADRSQSWFPHAISNDHARSGTQSAQLVINNDNTAPTAPTAILGIVQELQATQPTIPSHIAGYYKVTDWTRGTKHQYLQAVVMATRPSNKPSGSNFPTYQIAIPLAGITEPPFKMGNRRFAFEPHNTPPAEPTLNEWVPFEFNLHDLYRHHWGFVPEHSTSFKVFFEVRYDAKEEHEHPLATVYFDALYFGTPTETERETGAGD